MPNPSPSSSHQTLPTTPTPNQSTEFFEDSFEINLNDPSNDVESYIKTEQSKIDATLNFLLAYEPKRKVGRPKVNETSKSNSVKKIPDSVNDNLKKFTNINDLHPGVLIDHLIKVNSFNKKLLTCFEFLNEKYHDLSTKYDSLLESVNCTTRRVSPTSSSNPQNIPEAPITSNDKIVTGLQMKIDELEQKTYNSVLLINGPEINECTQKSGRELHESVIKKIRETVPEITESNIKNITVFGKSNQQIKVTCKDSITKTKLIIAAKKKKSKTLFFSEFLTNYRNKLFLNLRTLKKTFPDKLIAAYTRQGNIYYKLSSDAQKYYLLRHQSDIDELQRQMSNE